MIDQKTLPAAPAGAPPAPPSCCRLRRSARWLYRAVVGLLALGMLFELLLVLTPVTERLYDWLSVTKQPTKADWIVCLGGTRERILFAVKLYRDGYAKAIVVTNRPGAAEGMRTTLRECGIPAAAIRVDATSYTTGDHPRGVAALPGVDLANQRFLIVTNHEHSRRAAACFRKAGYQQFTLYGGPPSALERGEFRSLFTWRVQVLPRIAYEYAGLAKYWVQGKI